MVSALTSTKKNRYTLTTSCSRTLRDWDIWDETNLESASYIYPSRVLRIFDAIPRSAGWTVHVTHSVMELPSYGPRTIAIVVEDESARFPLYANRVRAVFKAYGTELMTPRLGNFSELNAMTAIHHLVVRFRRSFFSIYKLVARPAVDNVFDIPLGYYKQLDLEPVPMSSREFDLSFAGSVEHRSYPIYSIKRYLRNPKVLSRREMIANVEVFRRLHPAAVIDVKTTASFGASMEASALEYSQTLRNTKICIIPRGASFETFRWFEGARYGCVLVSEELPKRRYYDGAPCLRIRNWKELNPLLERLLADPELMQRLGEASRDWWLSRCSETATAAFMSSVLNENPISSPRESIAAGGSH